MAKKTKHRGKRGRKKGFHHSPGTLSKIRKDAKSRYKRSKLYKLNQKRKAEARKLRKQHGPLLWKDILVVIQPRRKPHHGKYRRGIIGGTYLARGRARRPKKHGRKGRR